MKGFSGARFSIQHGQVYKQGNDRLLEQGRRQRAFHTDVPRLMACPVTEIFSRTPGQVEIVMPFVKGVCPLQHDVPALSPLFEYFHERLLQSSMGDVGPSVMLDKLASLDRKLSKRLDIPDGWQEPFRQCESSFVYGLKDVPLGPCHGDFTFTNMLQTENEVVLFDFLDNVFDSVLLDMVKLRQDTACRWANIVLERPVDPSVLKHVDWIIDGELRWYECYRRYYRPLQQFNLLRILPYTTEPKVIAHVIAELNNL